MPAADDYTRQGFVNFTRWSARLPGTQRRAAARTEQTASPDRQGEGSVPAARAEQVTDEAPPVPAVDELRVREVLDRVPSLVALVHGPDHRVAYVNDAYRTTFGARPLGERARDALPELDALGLFPLLDQVQRSGKPRTVKSRKAPDGRSYTFTCTPVAQGDRKGGSDGRGVLVFATDVTDHAEAAERLRASERRQRETAVTLQRSLLPQELEEPDDLRIAATYHPGGTEAAVGGDWYDVITLGGGRTALVIGDVMGRGVRAAAVMGQLRTAVRAYARLDLPPHEVLQLLDGLAAEIDANQIATCAYAVHDPNEGKLVYASAGHLPILVRDENGTVLRAEEPTGPPLGTGGWMHTSGSIPLSPGSTAVLYTDGLVERRDADLDEGIAALERALSGATGTPQVVCDRLVRSARRHPRPRRRRGRPGPPAPRPHRPRGRALPQRRPGTPRRRRSGPPRACLRLRRPHQLALPRRPARPGSPRHQRTGRQLPPARHPADAAASAPHRPPPDHRGHRRRRPPPQTPPRGTGRRIGPRHRHRRHDRVELGMPPDTRRRQGGLVRVRPAAHPAAVAGWGIR
ncbi:magnesium or manganese-dependent protein phosphatase [Streptomyces viridochromogenes DSM 40736]|uniref:Magnesium or manganese-dependent protein phosphatase n=1 Tax=Streptomyces viridochromogenes (strain DSM 40736 / JCM 4977 / BCRC 1201 / Tue 494) TaxID=591159 RepID=D9WYP7_STRVT|nr:magnesium or manganese-dependent protein phosphatase [Streptomyces viridochromogenes DSM 40736]